MKNVEPPLPVWSWLHRLTHDGARLSVAIPVTLLFAAAIAAGLANDLPSRGALVILAILSLACLCARVPLLGCMVIIFLILILNANPVEQFWTRADDLALYVYNAWRHFLPQDGQHEFGWLKITTIDVLILAIAIGLLFAARGQRVTLAITPASLLVMAFASVVIGMFLWGIATGGELKPALWQVRPYLQLAAIALLLPQAVRNVADLHLIVWTLVTAITIKAALVIWIFFFIAGGHFSPDWRTLVDHEDSVFFVACFGFLLALFIYDNHPTKRIVLSVLSAVILTALLFNLRRAGYAALGLTILLMPLVVHERRKIASQFALTLTAVAALYTVLFWNDHGTLGMAAQKVRSSFEAVVGTEDYYSNFYRDGENLNLWQAIIHNPLGVGLGKPVELRVPLDDISDLSPLWQYTPHNMVLGTWMSLGTIGFIVFLTLIAGVMVAANFAVKQASDPCTKAVSVFCVAALAAGLLVGAVDHFMSGQRAAIFIGIVVGLGTAISFMQGHRIAGPAYAEALSGPGRTRGRNKKTERKLTFEGGQILQSTKRRGAHGKNRKRHG